MGHESIATTNRYVHFLGPSADAAGLELLNSRRGRRASGNPRSAPSSMATSRRRHALLRAVGEYRLDAVLAKNSPKAVSDPDPVARGLVHPIIERGMLVVVVRSVGLSRAGEVGAAIGCSRRPWKRWLRLSWEMW